MWFFKLFYLLVFFCFRFLLFQFDIRGWLSDVLSLNFILATLLILWKNVLYVSPLSANTTKWSNTLKQFVGNFSTNCLSVFDHFVKLVLKGLSYGQGHCVQNSISTKITLLKKKKNLFQCNHGFEVLLWCVLNGQVGDGFNLAETLF